LAFGKIRKLCGVKTKEYLVRLTLPQKKKKKSFPRLSSSFAVSELAADIL
jgi:hypothetical protein